ncbi:MAG: DNA polymerase III subunit [Candidatus Omnitrophica bacterium]|nr:DNA polymerase III subunit [Candidatus Omnitrophota bacterium]
MSLKDIKGQDRVVDFILKGMLSGKISHAYLFLGPSGIGRHKTAVEFAKLLNCGQKADDNCGICQSCIMIEKRSHPDVFFIQKEQGKKSVSIETIRGLQIRFSLKPLQGRYNIAVIDGEDMTDEASNSLLKMLEEPPSNTVFIIIASSQKSLLHTIVSRCQIIRFKPLSKADVANILAANFNTDEKEAILLSSLSGSDVKRALLLKEAGAVLWKNSVIDNFFGQSGIEIDEDIFSANRAFTNEYVCDILAFFCRDVLVRRYVKDDSILINADKLADIEARSNNPRGLNAQAGMDYINEAKNAFRFNANAKLTFNLLKEKLTQ